MAQFDSINDKCSQAQGQTGPVIGTLGSSVGNRRMFVWSGPGGVPSITTPAAGGDVDGIMTTGTGAIAAMPGWPVQVEAGSTFGQGVLLKTDSLGRAVFQNGTGVAVLRSLEANNTGAGVVVWAVWTSGR